VIVKASREAGTVTLRGMSEKLQAGSVLITLRSAGARGAAIIEQ
jgi:hypothetical protein